MPLDTIRTLWNRGSSWPTFIEFLPASVEEIAIVGPIGTGLASRVLDELAEAKEVHFPRLKSVYMSHIENPSRTKVYSENVGIVLELDDEEEDDEEGDVEDGF